MIGVCVRRYPISLIHGAGLIGCGQLNKDLRTLSFRISGCGALTGAVDVFLNPSDYLPVATQLGIKALIEGGTVTNAAHSTVAAAWPRSPEVPRASHQYAISIVFMRIASYRRMQLSREVLETSLARKQAVLAPLWQIYLRRRRGRRNTAGPPCERMSTRRLALLRKRGLTLFSPERLYSHLNDCILT